MCSHVSRWLLSSRTHQRVHSIVYGNLTILVIEKMKNVFSTLLEDLIPQKDGGRAGVDVEVVLRHFSLGADEGSSIVAEMEDVSLDT